MLMVSFATGIAPATSAASISLSDMSSSKYENISVRDDNGNLTAEGANIMDAIVNYAKTYSQTGGNGNLYVRNDDPQVHSYSTANCTCFVSHCIAAGAEFAPGNSNVSNDEFYFWNHSISNSSATTRSASSCLLYTSLEDGYAELSDQIDAVDEDLDALEQDFYEDEDDDEDEDEEYFYEVTCNKCGNKICLDEDTLLSGPIHCPNCNEEISFDVVDCDCDCEEGH